MRESNVYEQVCVKSVNNNNILVYRTRLIVIGVTSKPQKSYLKLEKKSRKICFEKRQQTSN